MLCWLYLKKNETKYNEILFSIIYCFRGKSILSITQQKKKTSKGIRFFSIEYSDLSRAQRLYQQEWFWMWFFTQAKSISCEERSIQKGIFILVWRTKTVMRRLRNWHASKTNIMSSGKSSNSSDELA